MRILPFLPCPHGSVENGGLEDDWLVSFWGPFSTEP